MGRTAWATALFFAAAGLAGCGAGERAEFDSLVDEIWLDFNEGRLVDAVEYVEGGQVVWCDYEEPENRRIGREVIAPMAAAIESEHGTEVHALLRDGLCIDLLVDRRTGDASESDLRAAFEAADAKFDGRVVSNWGHRWVSVQFTSPEGFEASEAGE